MCVVYSWVVLVLTYLLCIASFDWPFKYHWPIISHNTFVNPYLLHCHSDRNRKVWNFTNFGSLKGGKRVNDSPLWAPTQVTVRLILPFTDNHETDPREKGRDLTQSFDNTKTPPKTLITQQFRTDLKRSVGVMTATQRVWLNQFTGSQPSHQSEFRPNPIFLRQCLSWSASLSSSFDFCSKF